MGTMADIHHIEYHIKDVATCCTCGWVPTDGEDTLEAAAQHLIENQGSRR